MSFEPFLGNTEKQIYEMGVLKKQMEEGELIKKIDHIGIAVRSLSEAINTYKKLYGLDPIKVETLQDIKVRVAFIPLGEVLIEFLEPVEPGEGRIGRFLEEKGEGIHHVAFRVESVQDALKKLKKINIPLRDEKPRDGGDGSKIAFLDPISTQNVLTELVEREREVKKG
jgi:methylmalonyl-CoA/ethylmalonyl-CoA epimerase